MKPEKKTSQHNGLAPEMYGEEKGRTQQRETQWDTQARGKTQDFMSYINSWLRQKEVVGYGTALVSTFMFLYSRGYFQFFNWILTGGSILSFFYGLAYANAPKQLQKLFDYVSEMWQKRSK